MVDTSCGHDEEAATDTLSEMLSCAADIGLNGERENGREEVVGFSFCRQRTGA